MMVKLWFLVLQAVVSVDSANILCLYFPTYSHIRGPMRVASELAARGHVVWNALPSQLVNDKRLKSPGVNVLQYSSLDEYDLEEQFVDSIVTDFFEHGGIPMHFDALKTICDLILRDKPLYEKMKSLKLDLLILDIVPIARMMTVFAYKLDVPFVFVGASSELYASRTPFTPAAQPYPIMPWSPVMNFPTRLLNTLMMMVYWVYDPFSYLDPVGMYAPEKPALSMEALTAKAQLWLIEQEPLLAYPQASLPNVRMIGSLSTKKPKPLPSTYKKFVDGADHGVVVVSFGSNVKEIPEDIQNKFLEAFSMTNFRFILRNKNGSLQGNVMITEWMPQADLLAHKNTKLFITHCGSNGLHEAFLRGVPMIGFPMFAEQHYNAEKTVHLGLGMKLDLRSFTPKELADAIKEVVHNSSYAEKTKRFAEIANLRSRSPKDEAVFWLEQVLQYGGEHLRTYSQDMPLYQYLCLDVMAVILCLLHLVVFIAWKLLLCGCRVLLRCFPWKKYKTD